MEGPSCGGGWGGHFQFALIHGPDIPGSYAILLFTASDLASITSHIHNWASPSLLPSIFTSIRIFSNESVLCVR